MTAKGRDNNGAVEPSRSRSEAEKSNPSFAFKTELAAGASGKMKKPLQEVALSFAIGTANSWRKNIGSAADVGG